MSVRSHHDMFSPVPHSAIAREAIRQPPSSTRNETPATRVEWSAVAQHKLGKEFDLTLALG
jgi:hypothetical protein